MSNTNTAMGWATLAGIVLIAAGLLGFLNTSIAGDGSGAILAVDSVHNIVHILTGLVALGIAFGLRGEQQVNAVIGFGILYVVIFVAVLVSPNLFGLFKVNANAPIHVIHAAVAVVSLAVGYMARGGSSAMAR
jgi:hypothetical protein